MVEDIAEIERLQNIIARATARLKDGDAVGALAALEGTDEKGEISEEEFLALFTV